MYNMILIYLKLLFEIYRPTTDSHWQKIHFLLRPKKKSGTKHELPSMWSNFVCWRPHGAYPSLQHPHASTSVWAPSVWKS